MRQSNTNMVSTRRKLYSKTRTCKQPEKFTSNNITNKNNKNLLYFNLLVNIKTNKKYLNIGITYTGKRSGKTAYYERNNKELSKHSKKKIVCEHIGYYMCNNAENIERLLKQTLNPFLAFYKDVNGNTRREIFKYNDECELKVEQFLVKHNIHIIKI